MSLIKFAKHRGPSARPDRSEVTSGYAAKTLVKRNSYRARDHPSPCPGDAPSVEAEGSEGSQAAIAGVTTRSRRARTSLIGTSTTSNA